MINLSIEFVRSGDRRARSRTSSAAIRYAHQHGVVVVVAAAGNEGDVADRLSGARAGRDLGRRDHHATAAWPTTPTSGPGSTSSRPAAATTRDALDDPNCHPDRNLPDIYQMTFAEPGHPARFGFPSGWYGTSMAAPHVSAAAAMVIASGVLGRTRRPTSARAARGDGAAARRRQPNANYGYGLLDVGAATAPGRDRRAARSGRPDDQHRAGRVVRDLVRHRAEQEALGPGHALVADDDQVGALLLGDVEDRVGGVALARERLDRLRQRARASRCACSSTCEHVLARVDRPLASRGADALLRSRSRRPARTRSRSAARARSSSASSIACERRSPPYPSRRCRPGSIETRPGS